MTIEDILALEDKKKAFDMLTRDTNETRDRESCRNEYKGDRSRREESVDNRENKEVDVFSETETETDSEGNEIPKKTGTTPVTVAKIKTNIPKRIVRIAAAFLFGGKMNVNFSDENEAAVFFEDAFERKLKMKSVLNEFARTVMIETKSAIVFYPRPAMRDGKTVLEVKAKILSLKNGDFFPHFDEYGDMDGFIRKYKAIYSEDSEEYDFYWVQTATNEITFIDKAGSIIEVDNKTNLAGKITVVYVEQDSAEWDDIAPILDSYENRLSRVSDTNDYFGDPILMNYGESSLPSKKTVGKQISYPIKVDPDTGKEYHGNAEYLVWQQSIDSIKLELETLRNEIFSGSSTPDLSFENMRGIGALSGTAIELMFMEAFIKAAEKMELFGPAVQRCVSVVKALIANVTDTKFSKGLDVSNPEVTFGSILPDDLKGKIEMLVSASGGKPINSQETLVGESPFTRNVTDEISRLKKEQTEESQQYNLTGLNM